eukprot:GHVU01151908.1.p1 GENE.GHVU01151908.1~~GHVU01151908.1.p1  ORF type:complete len:357 (-),score=18.76 GHVU01151908.1:304-1374(-)
MSRNKQLLNYDMITIILMQHCGRYEDHRTYFELIFKIFSDNYYDFKLQMFHVLHHLNHDIFDESEFSQLVHLIIRRHNIGFVGLLYRRATEIKIREPANTSEVWTRICHHAMKLPRKDLQEMLITVNNASCLRYILQYGLRHMVDLDGYSQYTGETVLTASIRDHNYDVLQELLKHDIDTNKRSLNITEDVPIHLLLITLVRHRGHSEGGLESLKAFIRYGCDVNIMHPAFNIRNQIFENAIMAEVCMKCGPLPGVLEMLILAGNSVSKIPPYTHEAELTQEEERCQSLITSAQTYPCKLQHLCRTKMRSIMKTNIPGKLGGLGELLPPILKNYLLLPEIDDIIEDTFFRHSCIKH